jgi:hypothetical protein
MKQMIRIHDYNLMKLTAWCDENLDLLEMRIEREMSKPFFRRIRERKIEKFKAQIMVYDKVKAQIEKYRDAFFTSK